MTTTIAAPTMATILHLHACIFLSLSSSKTENEILLTDRKHARYSTSVSRSTRNVAMNLASRSASSSFFRPKWSQSFTCEHRSTTRMWWHLETSTCISKSRHDSLLCFSWRIDSVRDRPCHPTRRRRLSKTWCDNNWLTHTWFEVRFHISCSKSDQIDYDPRWSFLSRIQAVFYLSLYTSWGRELFKRIGKTVTHRSQSIVFTWLSSIELGHSLNQRMSEFTSNETHSTNAIILLNIVS